MIILITGGARSGKSRFAQEQALARTDRPIYVATARQWDDDFQARIRRHQQDRSEAWRSFEAEKEVSALPLANEVVVIDCVTLWLTNFFLDLQYHIQAALQAFQHEIDQLAQLPGTFLIVTNEIGMGVHAESDIGRKFTDLQGWANQYVAQRSDEVYLMVSGIPVRVKPHH